MFPEEIPELGAVSTGGDGLSRSDLAALRSGILRHAALDGYLGEY
jgi:hypothetical protein